MGFECLYDRRTLYPVSHIFTPFLIYLLTHNAFLTVTLFTAWEIVEYIVFYTFNSYIMFPPDGNTTGFETLCDLVLLDIGNGFLGLLLAWWIGKRLAPLQMSILRWIYTIIFGILWSLASPLHHECEDWLFQCDYTAWGIPIMNVLLVIYLWLLRSDQNQTLWVLFVVGTLYLNITWIPESTPLLMYYASILIFVLSLLIPWIYTKCGSSPSYARVERSTLILIT